MPIGAVQEVFSSFSNIFALVCGARILVLILVLGLPYLTTRCDGARQYASPLSMGARGGYHHLYAASAASAAAPAHDDLDAHAEGAACAASRSLNTLNHLLTVLLLFDVLSGIYHGIRALPSGEKSSISPNISYGPRWPHWRMGY